MEYAHGNAEQGGGFNYCVRCGSTALRVLMTERPVLKCYGCHHSYETGNVVWAESRRGERFWGWRL